MVRFHRTSALIAIMLILPTLSLAANALFDVYHGQASPMTSSDDFDEARDLLISAGHTLTELNTQVTAEALSGYNLYVSGTLDSPYNSSEIAALQQYVASGGNVLVIHDGGYASNQATPSVNEFLAPYGMVLSGVSSYPTGLIVESFAADCVTEGVGTIGMDFVRELESITSPAVDLTSGGPEILAVYRGNGTVIVLGDDSCFADPDSGSDYALDAFDNALLLLNLFDCVGGTVRTEAVSWSGVKALFD